MYNFSMVGGTLVVTEELAGQGHQSHLELLDVGDVKTAPCGLWGAELPVRIRQLHSHWLCRADNIIVVRPVSFLCHHTHYVICCNPRSKDSKQSHTGDVEKFRYSCLRIPLHLMQRPWPSLLSEHRAELTDELVLAQQSSLGLKILAKLEDSKFIQTYSQESASLLWELPRYGLEFECRDGTFLSRDYAGFKLADRQQLACRTGEDDYAVEGCVDYTLPNFEQYLVLERMHQEGNTFQAQQSDQMIIVPNGTVTLDRADKMVLPSVYVSVSKATDASLKVHRYEVHPRFGHLVASSILSSLQLAALYSATSSLLPEPRSHMTGAKTAMRLVRWSSTNQPLTAQERNHLERVARFGGHLAPGLRLLCLELEKSSNTQKHLHDNEGGKGRNKNGGGLPSGLFTNTPNRAARDDSTKNQRAPARSTSSPQPDAAAAAEPHQPGAAASPRTRRRSRSRITPPGAAHHQDPPGRRAAAAAAALNRTQPAPPQNQHPNLALRRTSTPSWSCRRKPQHNMPAGASAHQSTNQSRALTCFMVTDCAADADMHELESYVSYTKQPSRTERPGSSYERPMQAATELTASRTDRLSISEATIQQHLSWTRQQATSPAASAYATQPQRRATTISDERQASSEMRPASIERRPVHHLYI
eukprot:gene16734-23004_t